MIKLKPEVKEVWTSLMAANVNKQTTGALQRTDEDGHHKYCALGWLGVTCQQMFDCGKFDEDGSNFYIEGDSGAFISHDVYKKLTGPDETPTKDTIDDFEYDIYDKNDGEGWNLQQIADYVKEKY
jgi:hypothetical protein